MPQITWQRGKYLKFYAQMKIRIGGEKALDIMSGDEFEYDGSIVKYAGAEFSSSGVRGAIAQDWAILDPNSPVYVQPFVASRDVAKSQTKNTDLSRVQRTKAAVLETDSLDEETVLKVSDRRPGAGNNPRATPQVMTQQNNRRASTAGQRVNSLQISQSDLDAQDGEVVGRVRSPAKIKVEDITQQTHMARDIENRGIGQPEMFAPKKKNVTHREGVTIITNVGNVDKNVSLGQEDEGVVVAKVRHTKRASTDGIEVLDTSGPRGSSNYPKNTAGANADPERSSKPVRKIDKSKLSPKLKTALLFDPDFPLDWNFMAPLPERVSRAKQYARSEVFLKALFAAEGDSMKKALRKTYPKVFA